MPERFSPLSWPKRNFTATGVAVILLAAISCQPLRAQTETNSASSGVAEKWQNAKEKGSNAWENVKEGSVRAWGKAQEGASNTWTSVKTGTTQAWTDVKSKFASEPAKTNYLYAKKDEFVAQARGELDRLDGKIRQLSDEATNVTASAKAEAQAKLKSIKAQRGYLDKKLEDAKSATQTGWNKAQAGFQKAYDDTKSSVQAAWDWLKSKTS